MAIEFGIGTLIIAIATILLFLFLQNIIGIPLVILWTLGSIGFITYLTWSTKQEKGYLEPSDYLKIGILTILFAIVGFSIHILIKLTDIIQF